VEPGRRNRRAGRLARRGQRARHLAAQGLGLLEEIPRYLGVDQERRPDQQHVHVRAELVRGVVAVAGAQALGHRIRHLARRAGGLSHDDGRLSRNGAGPVAELPQPDHLVHHQQRDQQHEQPGHRVSGQCVRIPPLPGGDGPGSGSAASGPSD
jgi:hypothetical protein